LYARTVLCHQVTKDGTTATKGSGYFEPQSKALLFFVSLVTFVVGPSVEPPNREPQHFSANSAPACAAGAADRPLRWIRDTLTMYRGTYG